MVDQAGEMGPLLAAKLYTPPVRGDLVPRARLIRRLDEGIGPQRKLTLVSAPAGYGKTTLLSAWVNRSSEESATFPFAWLSLDERDNDPVRFWTYFAEALRGLPDFPSFPEMSDLGVGGERYLTLLLNQIGELSVSAVLVLDDFHLVMASVVHEQMTFLLSHLPPTLHLVIATRADPPLPIARLRARGELTELRQADLRFTRAEAAAFLHQSMGLELTDEELAALAGRTEGWIAGLQMAAVSMQRRDDLGDFVRAFAGSHRYVMDYLMEEVLRRQSAEVETFLLQTSILERLSASLCDAVCYQRPRAESQSILEYLEQSNLFITPLDERRTWYRYHPLFADLLQRQLAHRHPNEIPNLHCRASAWYEDHDQLPESIEHALAVKDFERAVTLIERVSEPLMMRGELMVLRRWLDALPEALLKEYPGLCASHAWLLLLAGEPLRRIEARIVVVETQSEAASEQILALRALIALFQGQIEGVLGLVEQARARLTEDDGFWYLVTQWLWHLLKMADEEALDRKEALPLQRLIRSQLEGQNLLLTVLSLCSLGELRMKQGRLHEAEALYNRALAQATDAQGERAPIAGEPLIWLGEIARERNDLASAERYLTEGLERISEWGRVAALDGYLALARLREAQGDVETATAALDQAEQLAVIFDATKMDDHLVAMYRARIAALQGNFDAVQRWAESRGLDRLDPDNLQLDATVELHIRKYELLVWGLARILAGHPREALPFLKPLLDYVAAKGRWGVGIEALALQATAHHLLDEMAPALRYLDEALARAEPEGYVRLFVEIGEPMARLLYQAAQRDIYPQYAGRLLAAFPRSPESAAVDQPPQNLIEPLSERELEILAAIAEGLSNQETARRLYISERTVKWHASNIYGKLQVNNRTEAVARARTLGILKT